MLLQEESRSLNFLISATYACLKKWEEAAKDAKECIRLDPQFTKGYYRLANAQLELGEYELAIATIKQGLTLDVNNAQLLKVLQKIQAAQKAKDGHFATTSEKQLDAATSQELRDIQIQIAETSREYNRVKANSTKAQREQRMNEVTLDELEKNPSSGSHFRSVGKVFMKQERDEIFGHLTGMIDRQSKTQSDLAQKLEFLERRLLSQQQNIRELTSSS